MSVPQQGSEKRTSILASSAPSGIGSLGSNYNPANAMKRPDELGIKVGSSMDDVVNAVKGVGFYTDQIGFGAPSTGLTNGMPLKPLGVNYFMNTGQKCSNGAKMWTYMQGIPDGSALGENVKTAMNKMGLPPLKGLAPGMLEDMQHALNPGPLMNALFGSGYAECTQVEYPVGDAYGRVKDPDDSRQAWVEDPDDPEITRPDGRGGYVQRRWIKSRDITKDEYDNSIKNPTYQPNGKPVAGFQNMKTIMTKSSTIVVVGVLCLVAFAVLRRR